MTSTPQITMMVILILSVGVTPALANTNDIQSPNAQFESGVPIEEIQCRDDRILMQSPSGTLACFFVDSSQNIQERGWNIVHMAGATTPDVNDPTPIIIHSQQSSNQINNITGIGNVYVPNTAPYCNLPSAFSIQVPNTAKVGESFNATITSSFELTQEEIDDFNEHHGTNFMSVDEIWNGAKGCRYKSFGIGTPYNYELSGNSTIQSNSTRIETGFYPPYNIYYHGVHINPEIDDPSVTFQMTISEPIVYRMSDIYDPDNDDYYKYDFGNFQIYARDSTSRPVSTIFTSISDGYVTLSEHEPTRSSIETRDESDPNRQFIPYETEHTFYYIMPPINHTEIESRNQRSINDTYSTVPFEWIAESLETEPFINTDPVELMPRLGLDDAYIEKFFKAYPQYRPNTQSFMPVFNWILPSAYGQTVPNLAYVVG